MTVLFWFLILGQFLLKFLVFGFQLLDGLLCFVHILLVAGAKAIETVNLRALFGHGLLQVAKFFCETLENCIYIFDLFLHGAKIGRLLLSSKESIKRFFSTFSDLMEVGHEYVWSYSIRPNLTEMV